MSDRPVGSLSVTSKKATSGVRFTGASDDTGTYLRVEVWIGGERRNFTARVDKERRERIGLFCGVIDQPGDALAGELETATGEP